MQSIVFVLSFLIQIIGYIAGGYHFIVSLFAWFPRREKELLEDKQHTFAMFIAAHNEQSVIANMVESLINLDYDKELYDVYVIADNCNDNTAEVAKNAGAIVLERENIEKRGKGHALEWAFKKVFEGEKQYDAICVFDADNITGKEFLTHMNARLCQGYQAVQGYIETKNPYDTWITASYAITFSCLNKLYQTARYNIGFPNQLSGTGFAIKTEVIKTYGWGATCLAEDMEFTMKLMLNNVLVGWAEKAVVYDEKPLTLSQSWKQRTRWMQGHADVASRFIPSLLKKVVKEKSVYCFDCIVYLLQPLVLIILAVSVVMGLVQGFYPDIKIWFMPYQTIPPVVWNAFYFSQLCYIPAVLWLEKKLNLKSILYYIPYMVFTYTWMPIAFIGVAKRNKKEWFHTQHTRTIKISEVE